MSVIWIVLYFVVGWIIAKIYDLDDGIMWLLVFLGWPILAVGFMIVFVLLLVFGLVSAADQLMYWLLNRKRTGKEQEK